MADAVVLVVDDDAAVRDMLTTSLRDKGYQPMLATNGQEALTHLDQRRSRPDVLLLDLGMPGVDGYTVLDHLRRRGQNDLPILIFSAHRPDASLLAALDAERRDFIAKPFDLDELHVRLQRLLRSPRSDVAETATVQVYTLGALRVYQGGVLLFDDSWRNKPAKSIFKILLTAHGQRYPKEALIEHLWPEVDPAVALNRLRVAMHDLREQLGDLKAPGQRSQLIIQHEGAYIFDSDRRCWTDASAFEEALRRARELVARDRQVEALEAYGRAETLYGGDYLRDDPYAEWSMATRERLREAHLALLGDVARLQAQQGDVDAAVRSCRRILHREPWREEVYRQLIRYLAAAGRCGEALRVFEECRRALQAEGLDLSPATWRLRQRIVEGSVAMKVRSLKN